MSWRGNELSACHFVDRKIAKKISLPAPMKPASQESMEEDDFEEEGTPSDRHEHGSVEDEEESAQESVEDDEVSRATHDQRLAI